MPEEPGRSLGRRSFHGGVGLLAGVAFGATFCGIAGGFSWPLLLWPGGIGFAIGFVLGVDWVLALFQSQ